MLPELVPVLSASAPYPEPGAVVRLECRKVPHEAHRGPTVVLPCLGATRAGLLMAHTAAGVRVDLVDRGWCETCELGCRGAEIQPDAQTPAEHPAREAFNTARLWLDSVGVVPGPEWVREPLPLAQRCDHLPPAPPVSEPVSRRAFFRSAMERSAGRNKASTPMGGDGRAAYPAGRRQASPERERQRMALTALAQAAHQDVPAEFFPDLRVNDACCDQRLCVALCPTAALTVCDDGVCAQLQVSAERCISCGACERACPHGAIKLHPHAGEPGVKTLATHARTRCAACGDVYTPALDSSVTAYADGAAIDNTHLCPSCTKSQRFMDDARRQLFGDRV